jgi:hypothetical protein
MYRLDSLIICSEAALAVVFFGATLFGLKRKQKWAPILAIAITGTQRVFAIYVFFPSIAIPIPLIWSLLIIYVAFKGIKISKALDFSV